MSISLSDSTRESIDKIKNINNYREAYYKIKDLCFMKLNIVRDVNLVKYIPRQNHKLAKYYISQGGWASIFSKTPKRAIELMDDYVLKPSHPEKLMELPEEFKQRTNNEKYEIEKFT